MGILQARTLEWVAMTSSRASSQPRDQTQDSHSAGRFFYHLSHKEARDISSSTFNFSYTPSHPVKLSWLHQSMHLQKCLFSQRELWTEVFCLSLFITTHPQFLAQGLENCWHLIQIYLLVYSFQYKRRGCSVFPVLLIPFPLISCSLFVCICNFSQSSLSWLLPSIL